MAYRVKEFKEAIPGTGGLITAIAKKVGCAWNTAKKNIDEHAILTIMVENEKHKVDDMAENVIIQSISSGDIQTAKWWLERKRRDEFSTRTDITSDGKPLETNVVIYLPDNNRE